MPRSDAELNSLTDDIAADPRRWARKILDGELSPQPRRAIILAAVRDYHVGFKDGTSCTITARVVFDNGSRGLVFRGNPGGDKYNIVALFAEGIWAFYAEVTGSQEEYNGKEG